MIELLVIKNNGNIDQVLSWELALTLFPDLTVENLPSNMEYYMWGESDPENKLVFNYKTAGLEIGNSLQSDSLYAYNPVTGYWEKVE